MKHRALRATIAALCLTGALAHAGEAEVQQKVEAFIGAKVVNSVKATPYSGLYEVVLDSGELVYVNEAVTHIITGSIIDAATRRNMTEARKNELNAIDFSSLPLKQAVKLVRGKGERVIATFEDPNCGYCKKLAAELETMDNVTVYTFLYPILSPDSTDKSRRIWCSKDQDKAWTNWITGNVRPTADTNCDTSAIEANVALGQKLRIGGTPTIFLSDGTRIGGYLPADRLELAIRDAEAKRKR